MIRGVRNIRLPVLRRDTRSMSSALTFKEGAKVSLMGTNVAKAKVLGDIEALDGKAVRLQHNIPKESFNSTVTAYVEKNTPAGTNVEQALKDAKLGHRLGGSMVSALSAGERMRLQLAVAASQPASTLLLDQPTHVQGATLTTDDVQNLSEIISTLPKTCVVNSSDTHFLRSICNTVLNIKPDGEVEQLHGSYEVVQEILAERHKAESGSEGSKMSFKQKAGWFVLLLPLEVFIFWTLQYAGR